MSGSANSVIIAIMLIVCMAENGSGMNGKKADCGCRWPRILRPVCGDDGVTYDNAKVIRCANICNNKHIRVLYEGPCSKDPHQSEFFNFDHKWNHLQFSL